MKTFGASIYLVFAMINKPLDVIINVSRLNRNTQYYTRYLNLATTSKYPSPSELNKNS